MIKHKEIASTGVYLESPTKTRYPFGQYPCWGLYHTPAGARPKTALIAAHFGANFTCHYLASYMAQRGYGFLGWNTRFVGAVFPSGFALEHALIDLGVGMRWLREEAGVERVVIVGNSGGASLMGAYQGQAVDPHIDPGSAPPELLRSLIPADMYISLCAHPGRAQVFTDWLDPSVTDESDPLSRDPELDMFNPKNGPPYSAEFIQRYREAQVARNDRITRWAESELKRIGEGRPKGGAELKAKNMWGAPSKEGVFDRFFTIFRQFADLRFVDLTIDPSKRDAACYAGDPLQANYSGYGLAPVTSAREWLAMWSLSRTQIRVDQQLPRVHQPGLVISANHDRGCFPSYARTVFNSLGSSDKKMVEVDGNHYLEPPGDRDAVADLIAEWLAERGAVAV